jgi:uncharacterized protein (TIGR03083 family)
VTAEPVIQSRNIPRIQHDEAMAITAEENRRLWELLVEIRPDQWSLPTDCTRWDVRAIVIHLIASAEAQASAVEFVRQAVVGSRLTKQIGGIYPVDGLNEAGLRARSHLTPAELPELWSSVAARALRARRRMPRPIRALPLLRLAPKYWKPVGYLYDIGFTRDVWMHRVDLSRAIGRTFDATAAHDGRIVATRTEPCDAAADGLNLPRHVRTTNTVLWLAQPVHRAGDVRQAAHDRPVSRVDACRPNVNQYLAVPDLGLVDLPEFQHLG